MVRLFLLQLLFACNQVLIYPQIPEGTYPAFESSDFRINTTECRLSRGNGTIAKGKKSNESFTYDNQEYTTMLCTFDNANFTLEQLKDAEEVYLSGVAGLVIKSDKSITIDFKLIAEKPKKKDMWLGGFCTTPENSINVKGSGPGAGKEKYVCAGHAQWGSGTYQNGKPTGGRIYGFTSSSVDRIGGSTGGVVSSNDKKTNCGGGVIEISSNETVTIGGTITANAIRTNNSTLDFMGGSGGTIIIRGKNVTFKNKAKVEAKGDRGYERKSGSGGIIWIEGNVTLQADTLTKYLSTELSPDLNGATFVNGKNIEKPHSRLSGDCYYFNDAVLKTEEVAEHPSQVSPTNCKTKCPICQFVALYNDTCLCVLSLSNVTSEKVNKTWCNQRCSGPHNYFCGGRKGNKIFYSVRKGTKNESARCIVHLNRQSSIKLKELENLNITSENCDIVMERLDNIITAMGYMHRSDVKSTLVILNKVIRVGNHSNRSQEENVRFGQNTLNVAEKLLHPNIEETWDFLEKAENTSSESVFQIVEQILGALSSSMDVNETLTLKSSKFVTYSEVFATEYFNSLNLTFSELRGVEKLTTHMTGHETLFIPESLVDAIKGVPKFSFNTLRYKDDAIKNKRAKKNSSMRASNVISVFLDIPLQKTLRNDIILSFPLVNEESLIGMECRFIEYSKSGHASWNSRGCSTTFDQNNKVMCSCNHFTSFALLLDVGRYSEVDPIHKEVMHWMTYVGSGISLFCMFITLFAFAALKLATHGHTMIHTNLILSLTIAQILFLLGHYATEIKITCKIIAIFIHYFYLAAIFWMCVEGIHLFRKVVKVFLKSGDKKYYLLFGWVSPFVIVFASALAYFDGYGTEKACWLSMDRGFIWAFIAPVLLVLATNLVILAMVIRVMVVAIRSAPQHGETSNIKNGVRGIIFLLPLLGLTWIFGVLSVNVETVVFQYLFTITNSLQGFFIFLFHCVLNAEVRAAYKKQHDRSMLQRSCNESTSKHKKIKVADSLTKMSPINSLKNSKVHVLHH